MNANPRVLASALLAALLVGGSLFYLHSRSGDGGVQEAQALSLSLASGDVHHYAADIHIHGSLAVLGDKSPFDMTMSGTMLWRVDKVDAKGVAHVYVSLQDGTMTVNGRSGPMSPNSMTLRITPDGRILEGCTFGGPGAGYIGSIGVPGSSELAPVLPDGAVAPGTSWSKSFVQKFPSATGGVRFSTMSTYTRSGEFQGTTAAFVRTNGTARVNATVDLKKLAAEYGFPSGLQKGEDPKFHYAGRIPFSISSWIDPETKQLLHESLRSAFDVTLTGIDLPADDAIPGGKVHFTGTETVALDRKD